MGRRYRLIQQYVFSLLPQDITSNVSASGSDPDHLPRGLENIEFIIHVKPPHLLQEERHEHPDCEMFVRSNRSLHHH